jgi:mRNA interferase MazF
LTVRQGDIYYVYLGEPRGSEPGGWHYIVVVQSNTMNRTKVRTVVACVLTTNLRRGRIPGNVKLDMYEGRLPEQSVVNISQTVTVDKRDLGRRIGFLDHERMREIKRNIKLMLLDGKRP